LKCYKEKPTCSRCAKRGLTCQYVATKRGGRKHENRSGITNSSNTSPGATPTANATQHLPPLSSWFTPNSTTDPLPSPGVIYPSPKPTTSGASFNLFSNLHSPADQSLSSTFTDLTTDLDDFFASPLSFSVPDTSDTDLLGQAHFFSTGGDNCCSSKGPATLFDTFPRSPPNSRASPASDAQSYHGSRAADSPCSCLVRALGLMKQLFPSPSAGCMTSTIQGLDRPTALPTIQAVIAKNEHTIEAVSTMLQCSCSQDGYLLTIMSLIVFKVLSWYAAAARKTPSSGDDSHSVQSPRTSHSPHSPHSEQVLQDPAVVGSYCLDGVDSARMAAQLVLSELHRVQRLVNQLSTKLKVQAAKNAGGTDTPNSLGYENAESETTLPLSAIMLDQLEVDIRKRLRALSLEIVEGLKRE
jgi:Aflatoxin regulatory protein/Fungal Zn(2)-Cys(6) binuclear cluster domain